MLRHTTALRVVGVAGPPAEAAAPAEMVAQVPGAAPAEVPPALAWATAWEQAPAASGAVKVPALVSRRAAAPAQVVAAMPLRALPPVLVQVPAVLVEVPVLVQVPAWAPTAIARTARARVRRVSSRGSPGARRGFFAARAFSRARSRAPRATRARAGSRRPRSTRDPSSNVPSLAPFYEASGARQNRMRWSCIRTGRGRTESTSSGWNSGSRPVHRNTDSRIAEMTVSAANRCMACPQFTGRH